MSYAQLLNTMMDAILADDTTPAISLLRDKENFPPAAQLAVYAEGYQLRLQAALADTYPALAFYLGTPAFTALASGSLAATPRAISTSINTR